jgi:outer membrane protein assembly factor BamB
MRRIAGVIGYALLAVLMAGCFWTVPGQGANRQAFNSLETKITVATVGSLQPVWQVQLDEGPAGDPVTSWSGVHVNDTHSVYALDPGSGAEQWQYSVLAPRKMGQPFVRDDKVLVGHAFVDATAPDDVDEKTAVLDTTSGALSGELDGAVVGIRGSRAVISVGQWFRPPFGSGYTWLENLIVQDLDTSERVYQHLVALGGTPERTLNLQVTFGSRWLYLADTVISASPCLVGLMAFSIEAPAGGCSIFTNANWGLAENGFTPVLSNDQATVFFTGTDPFGGGSTVKAINATTGAVLWTGSLSFVPGASPALAYGKLYVPTQTGELVVFDAAGCGSATCAPLRTASTGTGAAITEQPAVAGGVVYTASADGSVHAFDAAGCATPPCAPIWSDSTGSPITGAPAVSDGKLYVGTEDGRLIAYGLP